MTMLIPTKFWNRCKVTAGITLLKMNGGPIDGAIKVMWSNFTFLVEEGNLLSRTV